MTPHKKILMLGDSLVAWGDWDSLLPHTNVINRGQAGEHVEDLAARLGKEATAAPDADHILIMAGTNNLLMGNDFFPAIFSTMLPRLAMLCPKSTITINSLMPMTTAGLSAVAITDINNSLQHVARNNHCSFLDMTRPFTEQCLPITRPCFLTDGIHLSTLGYQVWAAVIKRHIQALD